MRTMETLSHSEPVVELSVLGGVEKEHQSTGWEYMQPKMVDYESVVVGWEKAKVLSHLDWT